MEPYIKEQSRSNFFDIAPLLRNHEKKLRRELVLLTIRLESSSGRKRQQDTKWAQKQWEQLRRTILDAQLGGAFSYRLPNLEQIRQVVLFTEHASQGGAVEKQSSFSVARAVFPEDLVSHTDDEADEGFKTPVSGCVSGYASGHTSPQSPRSWAEPGTSSRQSAIPSPSQGGLVQRWRSPDHSPRARVGAIGFKEKVKAVKRKRLVPSPSWITEPELRSQSPGQQREAGAASERAAHRHHHHHHHHHEQVDEADVQEDEESAESRKAAVTLEEMHASLDRLTRIISEMALLISVSTVQSEWLGEDLHRRRSSSPAAMRRAARSRSISRHRNQPSRDRSASTTPSPPGTPAPPRRASRSTGRTSSRDNASFTPADNEESRESRRKKGKHPKPQRHQEYCSSPETCAVLVRRKANDHGVVTRRSPAASLLNAPCYLSSASSAQDVPSCSSRSDSCSELSIPQDIENSAAENNGAIAFAEGGPSETFYRPASVLADDERSPPSSEAQSPRPFFQHPPFAAYDEPQGYQDAFEGASFQEDGAGRLSPGEIQLDSGIRVPEPTFPVLEMQYEGQDRGFRGIARGACWSDPGCFETELVNCAENVDEDGGGRPVRCRRDDRLRHGGIPMEQGAKDDYPSQHIWRWANSESERVVDEAAMRRLELYRTTYGGNIDGQPPHMKAANLRLASSPQRVGQRMCQLQVVCIITPIAQETNSAPTSTVHVQATKSPSLPERKTK